MPPPGLLRLKVTVVRALAVEEEMLGGELKILNPFVTECFHTSYNSPRRQTNQKALRTQISLGLICI